MIRRFNKIGNREMYMNCAVVDVVPKGYHSKIKRDELELPELDIAKRDTQHANAVAQTALSAYPGLFVANLKGINNCVTKETQDVVFDAPGITVQFADGQSKSNKPSFGKGVCTGKGSKSAVSSSPNSSSPPPSSPGGNSPSQQSSPSGTVNCNDGQYHPSCYGGADAQTALSASSSTPSTPAQVKPAPQAQSQQQVQDIKTGGAPSPKVEQELNAYLKTLYGNSQSSKRSTCKKAVGPCKAPSRWIKRGQCTWLCARKGQASTNLTPQQKQIAQQLDSL